MASDRLKQTQLEKRALTWCSSLKNYGSVTTNVDQLFLDLYPPPVHLFIVIQIRLYYKKLSLHHKHDYVILHKKIVMLTYKKIWTFILQTKLISVFVALYSSFIVFNFYVNKKRPTLPIILPFFLQRKISQIYKKISEKSTNRKKCSDKKGMQRVHIETVTPIRTINAGLRASERVDSSDNAVLRVRRLSVNGVT